MHALLVTVGSSGDVFPFIAIARALQALGHRATVLVNPAFESAVKEAGVAYSPLSDDVFEFSQMTQVPDAMHPRRGSLTVLREFIFPFVPEIYRRTRLAIEQGQADVVVAHHIAYGAAWAAQDAGVPVAKTLLAPFGFFNPRDPAVFDNWSLKNPSPMAMRVMLWLGRLMMRSKFDPGLNRQRAAIGLPPARDLVFEENLRGDVLLGMWSPALRRALEGDPQTARICGFPWHDRPTHPEHDATHVERFLTDCERAGEPPVIFTLGTAVVHGGGEYFHHAAQACRLLNRRALLVSGKPDLLPPRHSLPKGVELATWAPYSQIFPRAAANVHHGGIGTTAQALRAGRPTVITPVAYDQFDNAARCERLGVSATVHFAKARAPSLAKALRKVLDDPAVATRAAALGNRLTHEDGAMQAATHIQALVLKHASR